MTTRVTRHFYALFAALAVIVALFSLSPTTALAGSEPAPATTPVETVKHPVVDGLVTRDLDGMRIHYAPKHEPVVRPLFGVAPEARERILADLSPDALNSVDIYMLPRIEDYFVARGQKPRSPHWASGLALLGRDVILIRLEPQGMARLELHRTLAHELSHIALHHHVDGRWLPVWFVEGFALMQTEDWTIDRAGPLAEAGLIDRIIPLYELSTTFPSTGPQAQLAYAESGHFVRWLANEFGRDKFRDFTARLGQGQKFERAFEASYGRSFYSFERQWRESLVVEHGWLALIVGSTTLFFAMGILFVGMYIRVRRRRKRAFAKLESTPNRRLPEHLQDFGPFAQAKS